MNTILFVDDDPEVLSSTRRLLYTMHRDWQVTYAASAAEALQKLSERGYDVVVSDIRMPGMSGIELLEQVRARYPRAVRIALSGHADREAALQASGLAHRYLAKPCPIDDIAAAIQQSLIMVDLVSDEDLRILLSQLKSVPSQPDAYLQILEELKQPEPSAGKVGRIISQDAGMAAKILQLVNSAFFGLPQTVIEPAQAVLLLGVETVRDLVLSIGIFSQFDGQKSRQVSLSNLWNHSQRTGGLAKMIAVQLKGDKKQVNDAFVGGLLHDVGKLILADNFPQRYQETAVRSIMEHQQTIHTEKQAFGADHAQVGAALLGLWGLSTYVVSAIENHHQPALAAMDDRIPVTAVHAADALDYLAHPEQAKSSLPPELDLAFLRSCGLEDQLIAWRQLAF